MNTKVIDTFATFCILAIDGLSKKITDILYKIENEIVSIAIVFSF